MRSGAGSSRRRVRSVHRLRCVASSSSLSAARSPVFCSHRIRTGPIWITSGPPDQITDVLVRARTVLPAGADGQLATETEPLETFPALNQSGVASWLVNVPSGERRLYLWHETGLLTCLNL